MAEPDTVDGAPEALKYDQSQNLDSALRSNDSEGSQDALAVNGHVPNGDRIDKTANTDASDPADAPGTAVTPQASDEGKSKPADDVPNDADTSEGEDIGLRREEWRIKYQDLQKRVKMAPKRAKQMYQYASIMEERVTFLEERYNEMENRLKMKVEKEDDDEDNAKSDQRVMQFKLNHQLWQEFKSLPSEKSTTYVIDILVEEPEYLDEDSFDPRRRTLLKILELEDFNEKNPKSKDRTSQATAAELSKAVECLRGHRLPERIRFNSIALQHFLRKHFYSGGSNNNSFTDPGYIMLRPFKALLHFEEGIRDLWNHLVKILDNMRLAGNSQESHEDGQNPSQQTQADPEKSGCKQDPDRPMAIDKATWSSIFKRLGLFHCDDCSQLIVSEWSTDLEVKKTFDCLFELIDNYLKPIASRLRQREAIKVRFADLWHLFRSDDEIITKHGSDTSNVMAMRVLRTNGGRRHIRSGTAPSFDSTPLPSNEERLQSVNGTNPFSIHAWYMDFDGTALTPVRRRFVIQPYAGERSITDLEVYPIAYAKDASKLKARLIERGEKFVKFATSASASYCDCRGEELGTKEELNDKVIVDMREYGKDNSLPNYSEPDALDMSETSNCDLGLDCILGPECYHSSVRIIHDQCTDKTAMKDYVAGQPIFQQLSGKNHREGLKPRDDDYAVCTYRLFAYKLRSRDWVEVHVDSLEDATLTDDGKGFERLVLPTAHKHIIKAQVKEHFRKKSMHTTATQDDLDLVRGKGQGLIILLHGAPGVGKTCTAETVADLVHKPLYPITCGDLGSTAKEVEENLKQHFTLASRWDCVMLLDEADVFLAKRKSEDLQRNSIVSVFLRIMEYYKGLLFLTTNRVGTFDEAFKSRVHISLFYADFDQRTAIKVWKTFIRQTKEAIKKKGREHFKVKSEEILQFAEEHWEENPKARWNGRQIRNAFHTAIAMAEFDARAEGDGQEPAKIVLGREQFAKIASTVRDFDKYMIETMGTTFEEKADKEKLRKLKLHDEPKKKDKDDRRRNLKKARKYRYESSSEDSEISSDSEGREKKAKFAGKGAKSKGGESDSDSSGSD